MDVDRPVTEVPAKTDAMPPDGHAEFTGERLGRRYPGDRIGPDEFAGTAGAPRAYLGQGLPLMLALQISDF